MDLSPFFVSVPMLPSDIRQRVRELIEPSVERLGFDLVAVEWLGDTRGPILRVSIDNPHGIAAKDCAEVSRYISPVLDEADPIEAAYTLEVSSPGIERPVQRLADYERFRGMRARIKLEEGHPRRRYTGVLQGCDGDEVLVEVDGAVHRVRFDTIDRANLILELDEYQRLLGPAQEPENPAEVLHDDE
jgi:ribosome maturation factor RimP